MEFYLHSLQQWMIQNAAWGGVIVFWVAFAECLPLIGVVVPGAVVLFAAGAMIGTGLLDFWSTVAWAAAGATLGDNMGYWLGYYYRERLLRSWPLNRYPNMLEQGRIYFAKHGGKSIALGRFVGPIRAVIPTVAGLMHMNPWLFFVINLFSAIAWAPVYLIPGVVLGTSLTLAAEVTGRLVVFLLAVVVLLWFSYWLAKNVYRFAESRAEPVLNSVLRWSGRSPWLRAITSAVVDPDQPETRGLFSWGLIILLMSWLALFGLGLLRHGETLLDINIYASLQQVRNPISDYVMLLASFCGDRLVLLTAGSLVAFYFILAKHYKSAAHWFIAVFFSALAAGILAHTTGTPDAPELPVTWQFASPLVDMGASVAFYGFLAMLCARHLQDRGRAITYGVAVVIIIAILGAKLTLGITYFSAALASSAMAAAWIAVVGVAYRRHYSNAVALPPLLGVAVSSVIILFFLMVPPRFSELRASLPSMVLSKQSMPLDYWRELGWAALPMVRESAYGPPHPFNLQIAGDTTQWLQQLKNEGWREPAPFSFAGFLILLSPQPKFEQIPILPQLHRGLYPAMVLIKPIDQPERALILRLWESGFELRDDRQDVPMSSELKARGESEDSTQENLFVGNVSQMDLQFPLGLFTLPKTAADFDTPLRLFLQDLNGVWIKEKPSELKLDGVQWHGKIALIERTGPPTPSHE